MKILSKKFLSTFFLIAGQLAGAHDLSITSGKTEISDNYIYIHTDRSYYFPGEIVFFKAYILNSQDKYQINDTLYIALIDQQGLKVSYSLWPLNNSLISGTFKLPEYLNEGAYMLVASTGQTRNSPEKMFSKVVNIINPETEITLSVTFTDSLYEPGNRIKARVKFSGRKNNPVSAGYSYVLKGTGSETLSGKGKTDRTGISLIDVGLPESAKNESVKLIITPDKRKSKSSTGIVIPTKYNSSIMKSVTQAGNSSNLKITIITNRLPRNDNAEVEIFVTDSNGSPVIANLSVSAAAILANQDSPVENNLVSYLAGNSLPASKISFSSSGSVLNSQVAEYFAQSLIQTIQYPGKTFIVQQKNKKKTDRIKEAPGHEREGYTSDRDIYDILMQRKPYHLENNKIIFGMTSMYSINNPEGAIVVVDGIKMGTDASILGTIPVPDIANISVSTNSLDIQKYSALNSVGVIEITMKKSKEFLNIKDPPSTTNTVFWGPDLITDSSGKIFLSFPCNDIKEVLITVNGISAEGVPGSSSANFQVR